MIFKVPANQNHSMILLNSMLIGKIKYQERYWERLNAKRDGEVEWNKGMERKERSNGVAQFFVLFFLKYL